MPATETFTRNSILPARRWDRPFAITLSDTVADANLQQNGIPFRYLHNLGAAGLVKIAWEPDATEETMYIGQGEKLEGGLWRHLKTTGTTAAGPFRGLRGRDDTGS